MLDTKDRWHETIAYLLWSYRVLVRNVVIWCGTLCWFCTFGPNVFKVFLRYILRQPGHNENYRYRYQNARRNEELVKAVVLFRAFNIPPEVFTTLKSNAKIARPSSSHSSDSSELYHLHTVW